MPVRLFLFFVFTAILSFNPASGAATSTVSVVVDGDGSVTSSPVGIDCSDSCSAEFSKSETVTLEASPVSGQTFLGWTGECSGVDPVCNVRANKDVFVAAAFTSSVAYPTMPLPKTGAVLCGAIDGTVIPCAGTGQDGEFQAGTDAPSPRFIDNGDGTVLDLQTGVTWTKAYCAGRGPETPPLTWYDAQAYVAELGDGACGLSDGSAPGDWRLPNILELISLVDWGTNGPPDGHPFTEPNGLPFDRGAGLIWSSTTNATSAEFGLFMWGVVFYGEPGVWKTRRNETTYGGVWPVKIQP